MQGGGEAAPLELTGTSNRRSVWLCHRIRESTALVGFVHTGLFRSAPGRRGVVEVTHSVPPDADISRPPPPSQHTACSEWRDFWIHFL